MADPVTQEILKLVFQTEGEGRVIQASKKLAKVFTDDEKKRAKAAKRSHIDAKKMLKETQKQHKLDQVRLKETKVAAATAERSAMKLLQLQKRLSAASDSEAKWLRKRIDLEKERYQVSLRGLKAREKAALVREHGMTAAAVEAGTPKSPADKAAKDVEAFKEFVSYDWSKAGEEMGEGVTDVISSLQAKDLKGLVGGLAKGVGAGLKGVGAGITRGVAKGAAGAGPMASLFKAIQPVIKGIGPMLNMVGKLAPIMGAISQLVIGIVKLFIDAESFAKDLNKEFLETAGTSQFFYQNMQRAGAAAADLEGTLKDMRDAATSLDNLQWGISKETYAGTIKALTSEGVSLKRITKEFENVSGAAKDAAGYARDWGTMVQMSVAYSRAFGVSLQEISSLQAEMMTEMGMGLTDVEKSFNMLAKGAEESGIATNKFFGIIRGVSADLSLYNTRMEDAVHMLTMLGKVMSPKNAQKFLQSSMQAVKNMGRTERLKVALLAGGKGAAVVDRDIKRHSANLADKIANALGGAMDPKQIQAAVESGGTEFMDILKKLPKEMQGEIREAQLELGLKKGMAKGGVFGKGLAMGETGPAAQLQILTDALKGFNGGKSLMEGIGSIGEQMMAENLGISIEQLNQMAKFEVAMQDQRKSLIDTMQNGTDEQKKELKLRLKKLGIITEKEMDDNAAVVSKINTAGYDQIMDTLDEDTKKQLQDSGKQIDYQKQTADFQTSLMDKLGILIDFLMNQLYNVFTTLLDLVEDLWDTFTVGQKEAKRKHKLEVQAMKGGNQDLIKAVQESPDVYAARAKVISSKTGQDYIKTVQEEGKKTAEFLQKQNDLGKQINEAESRGDTATAETLKKQYKELEAHRDKFAEMTKLLNDQLGGTANDPEVRKATIKSAADMTSFSADTKAKLAKALEKTDNMVQAAEDAGLTADQTNELIGKVLWAASPEQTVKALSDYSKKAGGSKGGGATPMTGAPSGSAQQQATANTATQGSGGTTPTSSTTTAGGGAPATGGGAPPAAGGGGGSWLPDYREMAKQQAGLQGTSEEQLAALTEHGSTLADIYKILRVHGVRMDWKYHHDDYEKMVEKGVLEGERQALFEYFLYSKLKESTIADAVNKGMKPDAIAAAALDQFKGGTALGDITTLQGNAVGGTVLQPAPGEVLASVAPGEKILPAGAGGGGAVKVVLELKGDMLNQIIKAKATEAAVEHDRRKKFTG